MNKKQEQLGMNPSTASGKLVKDLLYKFIVETGNAKCYHCGEVMERSNFSIEHKIPWLDSEDPAALFFDLDNISFSHLRCNVGAARKPHRSDVPKLVRHAASGRKSWGLLSKEEQKAQRRAKYLKYGC